MGRALVTAGQREALIRAAMHGVADELVSLDTAKSGSVTVHFQGTIPMKVEWRLLARPVERARMGLHESDGM